MLTIHLPRLPLAVALILLAAFFVSHPVLADLPTDGVKLIKEPGNKKLRMVVGDHAAPAIQFAGNETLATAAARQFAPAFGVRDPMTELRVRQQRTRPDLGKAFVTSNCTTIFPSSVASCSRIPISMHNSRRCRARSPR